MKFKFTKQAENKYIKLDMSTIFIIPGSDFEELEFEVKTTSYSVETNLIKCKGREFDHDNPMEMQFLQLDHMIDWSRYFEKIIREKISRIENTNHIEN